MDQLLSRIAMCQRPQTVVDTFSVILGSGVMSVRSWVVSVMKSKEAINKCVDRLTS